MSVNIKGIFQGRELNSLPLWSEDLRSSNSSVEVVRGYFTEVSGMVGVKRSWLDDTFHCSVTVGW